MPLSTAAFRGFLRAANFTELFIESGWDNPSASGAYAIELPGPDDENATCLEFREAAQKCGFRIWVCRCDELPGSASCRALDAKLRKRSDFYIAVFVKNDEPLHHLWLAPVKNVDKRNLVKAEYEREEQTDFIRSKIEAISFPLEAEVTIVDVLAKVSAAFSLNAAEVTRSFYREFKRRHDEFVDGIRNIAGSADRAWYASIMLNRLMFCYFIQKKGFLNLNENYLRDKLEEVQSHQGEGAFYGSFYKAFLRVLFQDGLNMPEHTDEFRRAFGRIPYLNGGMFEQHAIERDNPDIDIPDSVFERLFAFFDEWRWHLDTNISASGKDINPDVLGYIFEQYINDRAQMGAYYTKEDITEYIGRNTIVPFLLDAVAKKSPEDFVPEGYVWKKLRESGDRYIYAAVRKGVDEPLPDYIEQGVDAQKPDLLQRRALWNERTDEKLALPTEIWRETVARRQRCAELRRKIAGGEIRAVNDLITHNLDIRAFAEDLIREANDHRFVRHFYEALRSVTILDPTCGSGAFLFAALNILEPLYEACMDRMRDDFAEQFGEELAELRTDCKGNLQYFIYKNIILRNLYGVDIMREAIEIARLRLFLKMVAVIDVDRRDPNLGLEPLPDIDFNIRCGNTLVGYAGEEEIKDSLLYGDLFTRDKFLQKIEEQLKEIKQAAKQFREAQLSSGDAQIIIKAKQRLNGCLGAIRTLLDKQLYHSNSGGKDFESWYNDTQPFHWYAEFYEILVEHGGFDVVIGNPPYVEYKKLNNYTIAEYETLDCGDLYAFVMERSYLLLNNSSRISMVVPISIVSTDGFKELRRYIYNNSQISWISCFSIRPSKLFEGADKRISIVITTRQSKIRTNFVTRYYIWNSDEREFLFNLLHYQQGIRGYNIGDLLPKLENELAENVLYKISRNEKIKKSFSINSKYKIFHTRKVRYYLQFLDTPPIMFNAHQERIETTELKILEFASDKEKYIALSAYLSTLFYWYFMTYSDCRNLNKREIENFPLSLLKISGKLSESMEDLGLKIMKNLHDNSVMCEVNYKQYGKRFIQVFKPRLSKPIIDNIDTSLAKHYGFTEEELDYIINYDIKYRMGDELNDGE